MNFKTLQANWFFDKLNASDPAYGISSKRYQQELKWQHSLPLPPRGAHLEHYTCVLAFLVNRLIE